MNSIPRERTVRTKSKTNEDRYDQIIEVLSNLLRVENS